MRITMQRHWLLGMILLLVIIYNLVLLMPNTVYLDVQHHMMCTIAVRVGTVATVLYYSELVIGVLYIELKMLLRVMLTALLFTSCVVGATDTITADTITANISRLILAYEEVICSTCEQHTRSGETDSPLIKNGSIIYPDQPCEVCETCKCDQDCRFYGDCCADVYIGKGNFDFHCHPLSNREGFLVVSRCPLDAVNYSTDFARKCNNFDKLDHIESRLVSVRDEHGNDVTFRNIYCALCHGYSDFKKWNYQFRCGELPDNIIDMIDPRAIFSSMMESISCSIKQTAIGLGIYTRVCRPNYFATGCNITGHWREYSAEVETSCHAYYNPTMEGYNNIFCQLCNNNFISMKSDCRFAEMEGFVPFTGLLAFQEEIEEENPKCEGGYFWDILTEQCLQILCPPFHQLHNTECTHIIRIASVSYTMNISLFPYEKESVHIDNLSMFSKSLLDFYVSASNLTRSSLDWKLYQVILRHYYHRREGYLLVIKRIDVVLFAATQHSNTFANFTEDFSSFQFGDVEIVYKGKEYKFVSRLRTAIRKPSRLLLHSYIFPVGRDLKVRNQIVLSLVFSPKYIRRNCAQILYQESQYVSTHNNSILLVQSNILIPDSLTTRSEHNSLLVCISTLQTLGELYSVSSRGKNDNSVLSRGKNDTEAKAEQEPLTILTVVCLTISLFFLVLTFSVYSFLSELRSIPGYNLMFLIKSLFLSQCIFLLAARYTKYEIVCTVIGVLLHYFWLVTFAWMIVCTFHAFRVLRNVLSSINQYTNTRMVMLKYSLFSYLTPGIIITVNIVTNYFISSTSSIGYADEKSVCFVNPGMTSILAFGVPVLFTILVTGFCFIYTVVSVRRASSDRVEAGMKSRGILFTVLKLSTITSLSWIFGLLGSVLSFQPFQYVFVLLAAGQGLFIFFAFVVNRRVLELCRNRYEPKQS